MSQTPEPITSISLHPPFRVSQLGGRKRHDVDIQPDAALRQQIAEMLGLEGVKKFRFKAELRPLNKSDWELVGTLGATIVQACAITLAPVTSRIDERVTRRFLADMPEPQAQEIEMPEDDSVEALGAMIDASAIAIEALTLAIRPFPRAEDAKLSDQGYLEQSPPDSAPLPETTHRPFAGLADLKAKLAQTDNDSAKSDK
ncbi:YceD family protein [Roseinatronobacter bogoriensis]|uniref:YceD family protein n=1 Tax=Roseinatronobacter bogoriensis TaxID=119542 RepID=UPI00182CE574|nr:MULTISPECIES: DUF177 domain-containing protein [Rhodobaca]MBB4207730.1 uncharacterized metal-binding protein YceD (DUF177 family) [Rhodobaca bogoriensis DSM 18756]